MRLFPPTALSLLLALAAAGPVLAAPGDVTAVPRLSPRAGEPAGFDLVAAVTVRYARTLALLKAEFPSDYASLMADIAGISWAGGDPDAALLGAFGKLTELRRKYAEKLLFAPSLAHSVMLGHLAEFYDSVFEAEGPAVCERFARDGSAVLFELGLSEKYARALDQQSAAFFEAVVQAIENPSYSGVATSEDWSAVLGTMVGAGAPQSYVAAISSGRGADLCPALAAMFRTAGLLDTPAGQRTRADFAKNLTGY